jgi:uncharacterized phage protein (TIGR01671 family)
MSDRFRFRCFGNENALFLQGMHKVNSFEIHEGGETASIYYDNGSYDGCVWLCNVSIMQYTGLKDGTGKLIFEGDIVNFTLFYFTSDEIDLYLNGIIRWSDNYCGFYIELINTTKDFKYVEEDDVEGNKSVQIFYLDNGSDIKIIGNIYENPDLLRRNVNE